MADVRYLTVTEALERCRAAGVSVRVMASVASETFHQLVTVSGPARPDEVAMRPSLGHIRWPRQSPVVSHRLAQVGPDTWDFEVVYSQLMVQYYLDLGTPPNQVRLTLEAINGLLDGQVWPPSLEGEVDKLVQAAKLEAALHTLRVR